MHKWIMFTVFIAASLLGVFLLTFKLPEKPVDEAALMPDGVTLMKVVASNDFTFNQDVFTAKVGDKVIMRLENKSGVHGLKIDELQVSLDNNNKETELEFTEPGEYIIYCSIACGPGHQTMQAKLVVEAA